MFSRYLIINVWCILWNIKEVLYFIFLLYFWLMISTNSSLLMFSALHRLISASISDAITLSFFIDNFEGLMSWTYEPLPAIVYIKLSLSNSFHAFFMVIILTLNSLAAVLMDGSFVSLRFKTNFSNKRHSNYGILWNRKMSWWGKIKGNHCY